MRVLLSGSGGFYGLNHYESPLVAILTMHTSVERLGELVLPAMLGQLAYYRSLGIRNRSLSLPVMVAAVLTVLWRQVPPVCELACMLVREELLWAPPVKVSQQTL
jgi:hypothetical protein